MGGRAPPSGVPHPAEVTIFSPLLLAAPLLLLAIAVTSLWAYGPLGWVAAVALLVAVVVGTWRAVQLLRGWWRGTRVAPRPQVRPADLRRQPRP